MVAFDCRIPDRRFLANGEPRIEDLHLVHGLCRGESPACCIVSNKFQWPLRGFAYLLARFATNPDQSLYSWYIAPIAYSDGLSAVGESGRCITQRRRLMHEQAEFCDPRTTRANAGNSSEPDNSHPVMPRDVLRRSFVRDGSDLTAFAVGPVPFGTRLYVS